MRFLYEFHSLLRFIFFLKAPGAETSWTLWPQRHKTAIPTTRGQEGSETSSCLGLCRFPQLLPVLIPPASRDP